jgi:[protein-PII] uridylyltransferase
LTFTHQSSEFLEQLRRQFEASGDAAHVLEGRTSAVEQTVCGAYDRLLAPKFPDGLALLAVGGFGRREMFPHSDVDLLFLTEQDSVAETQRESIADFLRILWDSGLRVSHSVRTPAECCELHEQNIELNINLLDQRFLAGDRGLYARLCLRLSRFFHGQRQELARHLCRMARSRHAKYQDTLYQLEPNLKDSPGGLRDYQLLCWASQLHNTHPDRIPKPDPDAELGSARDFLRAARCFLHYDAGRDQNVLTFDLQERIADAPALCAAGPAAWMRSYFRHAREVRARALRWMEATEEQSSNLLTQFRDWRSRISNAEFYVSRERVYFRSPQQLEPDPELALRLFQFVARHGLRLAQESERRIAEHLPRIRRGLSEPGSLWPAVRELLALPHAAMALRAMQDSGALAALFPEWERIECLVVRDFYHRYTVDEHTLVALQKLSDLSRTGDPLLGRFRDLLAESGDPAVLNFAVLFHDTGKASRSGEHVAESALLAEGAMERIGMPAEQRRAVKTLIERHLELSAVMNSRDLEDPRTARFMAGRAGTVEVLKQLTLLTYADIAAVNPDAMTPWRAEQLWRVYLVTYGELTRELDTDRVQDEEPELAGNAAFVRGFPVRYLRTHSREDIAAHAELARRAEERGVAFSIERRNGTYVLVLTAKDRPFLMASVAGALAGFGMNILKAEGYRNRAGLILDTFVFADPLRTLELNPSELDRLRITIERIVLGRTDARSLLQNRPKPVLPSRRAAVRPSVAFDNAASESATLLHVVAQDRPGLLYDLASAISGSGCNIELVLIDTEAHRALDVFYLTKSGRKLSPAEQDALRPHMQAAIEGAGRG